MYRHTEAIDRRPVTAVIITLALMLMLSWLGMIRHPETPPGPIFERGTLVVMVPTNEGLLVASDSRTTGAGTYCDGQQKSIAPSHPDRTVFTVTGIGTILAPPNPSQRAQLCEYLRTGPRLLDIVQVVRTHLDRAGSETILTMNFGALVFDCIRAAKEAQASNPKALANYANQVLFQVVLAAYDPAFPLYTFRNFKIGVNAQLEPFVLPEMNMDARGPGERLVFWKFGESDFLEQHILKADGVGRNFLTADTIRLMEELPIIQDVGIKGAQAAAADLIQATERMATLVPPPSGIGGPVDIFLLGQEPRPVHMR